MSFTKQWKENMKIAQEEYGSFVNLEDGFYLCPECGEPIYNEDWTDEELKESICPICFFDEEDDF